MSPVSRREFLALSAALGVGVVVAACGASGRAEPDESVLVIGAGAAGMATGYLLAQRGIDYRILEAAPTYGGRIKRTKDFVDFPIPLGGEWLHADEGTLTRIVNDADVEVNQPMASYQPTDALALVVDGQPIYSELGAYSDLKFVGATWLDFFDEYVVGTIASRMVFNTEIVEVHHDDKGVALTDAAGGTWNADRVIVTVPMKVLQDGRIAFDPALPDGHREALAEANIWTGMKVFIEFSERFYPTFIEFEKDRGANGQRAYYDASYGQDTNANVLGLFLVGDLAQPYQALDEGTELAQFILNELDGIFDGAASPAYVQHVAQNWANEPFIGAAYLADDSPDWIPRSLGKSVGRVSFAGCSYTREFDWSSVHTAVQSARDVVQEIFG